MRRGVSRQALRACASCRRSSSHATRRWRRAAAPCAGMCMGIDVGREDGRAHRTCTRTRACAYSRPRAPSARVSCHAPRVRSVRVRTWRPQVVVPRTARRYRAAPRSRRSTPFARRRDRTLAAAPVAAHDTSPSPTASRRAAGLQPGRTRGQPSVRIDQCGRAGACTCPCLCQTVSCMCMHGICVSCMCM